MYMCTCAILSKQVMTDKHAHALFIFHDTCLLYLACMHVYTRDQDVNIFVFIRSS